MGNVPLNVIEAPVCKYNDVVSKLNCMQNFYDNVECKYPYSKEIKTEILKQGLSVYVDIQLIIDHIRKHFKSQDIGLEPDKRLAPYNKLYVLLVSKYNKDKENDDRRYKEKKECNNKIKF